MKVWPEDLWPSGIRGEVMSAQMQSALQAFQSGQLEQAESLLAELRDTQSGDALVWRLSGAVARARSQTSQAEGFLRHAIALAPDEGEAWNTLGLLLDAQGRTEEASTAFQAAQARMTGQAAPSVNLARLLLRSGQGQAALAQLEAFKAEPAAQLVRAQAFQAIGQPDTALSVYAGLAASGPASPRIAYGEALCLLDQGEWEAALTPLDSLARQGVAEAHYPRFTALARMGRTEEAFAALKAVLSRDPSHIDALHGAAQLYWMTGEGDQIIPLYDMALKVSGGQARVYQAFVDVLLQMGEVDTARQVVEAARTAHGPAAWCIERALHVEVEAGDAEQAWRIACEAERTHPDDPALFANRCRAGLMSGAFDAIAPLVKQARAQRPSDRFWVAMDASLARAQGRRGDYAALVDMDRFVRSFRLQPPTGYADISAFNAALAACLQRLHAFSAAPLDQSLRGGVQTPSDLRFRKEPEIRAFLDMVKTAVGTYRDHLCAQPGHPLTGAMPATPEVQGAWSVRLGPGGRHVNHVHPEGWISSVYYVSVPSQVRGSKTREGWLKFGEPPFAVKGLAPHDYVEPVEGELTLFPSYLWHGTVPITSGERLTIALDIKPAKG